MASREKTKKVGPIVFETNIIEGKDKTLVFDVVFRYSVESIF